MKIADEIRRFPNRHNEDNLNMSEDLWSDELIKVVNFKLSNEMWKNVKSEVINVSKHGTKKNWVSDCITLIYGGDSDFTLPCSCHVDQCISHISILSLE